MRGDRSAANAGVPTVATNAATTNNRFIFSPRAYLKIIVLG
jgi:hypothetical protein